MRGLLDSTSRHVSLFQKPQAPQAWRPSARSSASCRSWRPPRRTSSPRSRESLTSSARWSGEPGVSLVRGSCSVPASPLRPPRPLPFPPHLHPSVTVCSVISRIRALSQLLVGIPLLHLGWKPGLATYGTHEYAQTHIPFIARLTHVPSFAAAAAAAAAFMHDIFRPVCSSDAADVICRWTDVFQLMAQPPDSRELVKLPTDLFKQKEEGQP